MTKNSKIAVFVVLTIIIFFIGLMLKEAGFLMGIPIAGIGIIILYRVIFKSKPAENKDITLNKKDDEDITLKK